MTASDIKNKRVKLKIPIVELAARTGLPSSYLERIEEGQVQPQPHEVERIVSAFKQIEVERVLHRFDEEVDDSTF